MAIQAQATSLGKDLISLYQRELDLLRVIYEQNQKFDRQVIDQESKLIDQASV